MLRRVAVAPAVLLTAAAAIAQPWVPDPLAPASSGGLEAVERALARLSIHARLLVVGAHPDDEDNALLAWVGRGLGGEAAYLSLSRGEGGQNLIGPELGVELGVIRTGELLAARAVEGRRQYFARAYDFGYTRSLDETFARWPREVLQEDAVRIVRRFKPQVVVAVFPADERAGHGQHQASAVIAREAYELAGDGGRFGRLPGAPWAPQALYRRAWRGEEASRRYSLAALEPLSGRSLGQLAAASRSFHRSQDMGRIQEPGPASAGLVWLHGGAGAGGEGPFDGVDTRLQAIVETLPQGAVRAETAGLLAAVERLARQARRRLSPADPGAVVPDLAAILRDLRRAEGRLAGAGAAGHAARELVAEKIAVAESGLAAAAGVVLDAVTDRETVALGGALELSALVWPAGGGPVDVVSVTAVGRNGWLPEAAAAEPEEEGGAVRRRFRVSVPAHAALTIPYYLRRPRVDALYDWTGVAPEVQGEPFQPPPLAVRFELEIEGTPVALERQAVYRYGDQAYGERRRPLRALPVVEVGIEPGLVLWPGGSGELELAATVRSNADGPVAGRLRLAVPPGWPQPEERSFELAASGSSQTLRFHVRPVADPGRYVLTAVADRGGGGAAASALSVVEYPHVRPAAVPAAAATELSVFELELPSLTRVGYVRGASDRLPEILAALGLPVEVLGAAALERGDLSGYDAIVVGSRAYETEPVLARANDRLLDYLRGGGLLVVQYQQYQFVRGGFAPWPLEIGRPHGRVTDETAPVELLAPEHPVFHRPNRIGAADWRDWVQERGLYFAGAWDDRYRPLLALADPGREPERGALLVAPVGEGTYVYTGLSFFRQLPAGVPGAVRLFVNLLALGER